MADKTKGPQSSSKTTRTVHCLINNRVKKYMPCFTQHALIAVYS